MRDVVNNSGAVVASYEFDEYGRRLATSESGVSSQKTFVGGMSVQDEVADTGLMMMGHRFYAPDLGRFLNRDPIGFAGGMNLFEYANGRPHQAVDPDGTRSRTWADELHDFSVKTLEYLGYAEMLIGAWHIDQGTATMALSPAGGLAAPEIFGVGAIEAIGGLLISTLGVGTVGLSKWMASKDCSDIPPEILDRWSDGGPFVKDVVKNIRSHAEKHARSLGIDPSDYIGYAKKVIDIFDGFIAKRLRPTLQRPRPGHPPAYKLKDSGTFVEYERDTRKIITGGKDY